MQGLINELLTHLLEDEDDQAWVGFDLDGTLAKTLQGKYEHSRIGEPIPKMVSRLRRLISHGKKVKIFTARADDERAVNSIRHWLKDHDIPSDLEITNLKDHHMVKFYDDKAIGVQKNTGEVKEGRFRWRPEPQPRHRQPKEIKGPPPTDPHAHAAYDAGGTLIYTPLNRQKFQTELDKYAPGCGSPIRIEGTNGGTMPCGATLNGQQVFCRYCDPAKVVEHLLKEDDEIVEGILLAESPEIATLKKNQTKLDPEEREQVMKAGAVWHMGKVGAASPA